LGILFEKGQLRIEVGLFHVNGVFRKWFRVDRLGENIKKSIISNDAKRNEKFSKLIKTLFNQIPRFVAE
jgi:hypothetical protein